MNDAIWIVLVIALFALALITIVIRAAAQDEKCRHAERLKSLELGIPLMDAQVARSRALGAIGVWVPAASLASALFATFCVPPSCLLAIVWVLCTLLSAETIRRVVGLLKLDATSAKTPDETPSIKP